MEPDPINATELCACGHSEACHGSNSFCIARFCNCHRFELKAQADLVDNTPPSAEEIKGIQAQAEEWFQQPIRKAESNPIAQIAGTSKDAPGWDSYQQRVQDARQPKPEKPSRSTAGDLICLVDVETSGLLPWSGAEILEFACILLQPDLTEIDRYGPVRLRMLIPENAEAGALAINGIKREDIESGLDPCWIWREWCQWLRSRLTENAPGAKIVLGGHNYAAFDSEFLRAAWKRYLPASATKGLFSTKTIDTMLIYYWQQVVCQGRDTRCDLRTCCEYYGIPTPDHSAIADVVATVDLLRRLKAETCLEVAGDK